MESGLDTGKRTQGFDLGEKLIEKGLLDREGLAEARSQARKTNQSFKECLVEQHFVDEEALLTTLSELYHIPKVNLEEFSLTPEVAELLPYEVAYKYQALPLGQHRGMIVLAMREPQNMHLVDELRFYVGRPVQAVFAPQSAIMAKLNELYGIDESALIEDESALEEALADLEVEASEEESEAEEGVEVQARSASSPIAKLVNEIFIRAFQKRASDIHIESAESAIRVRFRVDGALRVIRHLPKKVQNAVISRLKVLGAMDISDSRRPQDGRIKLRIQGHRLDIRVSTLPTFWGEKVVMRLLDQSGVGLDLDALGFLRAEREKLDELLHQPQGLILVTGPTGSGKTTTLYSALSAINTEEINLTTIEDPVEYQLPGINQVPVNPKAGMTFAAGLRALLRQDPDVLMVGEIRDYETADIALEAAETGHRVFSTLHTTSASGAVTRLLDMGVPGYLVASSLSAVLAQRLLRCNCPDCSEPMEVAEGLRKKYRVPDAVTFYRGTGCSQCDGLGKKGRIGVYELLVPDRQVLESIYTGASEREIRDRARQGGMHLMIEDGLIKAMRGTVDFNEMIQNVAAPPGAEFNAKQLLEQADAAWEERRRAPQHQETKTADEPETLLGS